MLELKRPARGLGPHEALQRYSNASDYAALREFGDPFKVVLCPDDTPTSSPRFKAWRSLRDRVEGAFLERLQRVSLAASAIPQWRDRREVMDRDLWEVLWVNYEFEEIVGQRRSYLRPEFFEPSAIPMNIREVPAWFVPKPSRLRIEADFRHIWLDGQEYLLGPTQAAFFKRLYETSQTDKEWCNGKEVLRAIGAGSTRVGDLFKGANAELIESDKRGLYRLNMYG